jgi:hypothetical protein
VLGVTSKNSNNQSGFQSSASRLVGKGGTQDNSFDDLVPVLAESPEPFVGWHGAAVADNVAKAAPDFVVRERADQVVLNLGSGEPPFDSALLVELQNGLCQGKANRNDVPVSAPHSLAGSTPLPFGAPLINRFLRIFLAMLAPLRAGKGLRRVRVEVSLRGRNAADAIVWIVKPRELRILRLGGNDEGVGLYSSQLPN